MARALCLCMGWSAPSLPPSVTAAVASCRTLPPKALLQLLLPPSCHPMLLPACAADMLFGRASSMDPSPLLPEKLPVKLLPVKLPFLEIPPETKAGESGVPPAALPDNRADMAVPVAVELPVPVVMAVALPVAVAVVTLSLLGLKGEVGVAGAERDAKPGPYAWGSGLRALRARPWQGGMLW